MTSKLRNMGYILCIGATLVFLGSIGIYNSGPEIGEIWKTFLIGVLALFLIGISIVAKNSFKMEKFDSYILAMGYSTLMCMYISIGGYELLGKWFSFSGEGCYIFLASIFILMSILFVLMKVKTKLFFFYELAYIAFTIALAYIIYHFTGKYETTIFALPTMLLFANIFAIFRKKFSIFTIFTFISIIFNLGYFGTKEPIFFVLFNVINMLSILAITYNYRNKDLVVIPTIIFGINTICLYTAMYILFDDANITAIVMAAIVALYDITFTFLAGSEKQAYNIISKVFTCIFLFVSCCLSNFLFGSFIYVIILASSLISVLLIKSDKTEKYILPFKVFLIIEFIFGHLYDLNITVEILGHVVANLSAVIALILVNNKAIRTELIVITILSLILSLFVDRSVLTFVFGIALALFDYIAIFFICSKFKDNSNKKTFFILLLFYILLAVIRVDFDFYKYLICAVAYTILFVISYKDKLLAGFSLGFVVGSLFLYSYAMSDYRTSLYSAIIFGCIFAFPYLLTENKHNRDEAIDVAGAIFLIVSAVFSFVDFMLDVSFTMVFLTEAVTMLIYSNIIDRKFLFNTSMVVTAFIIIRMLFTIEGIPTAVVVTLTGIIIIVVLLVMIRNYLKKDLEKDIQREHPTFKFCGQCGTKLDINATICPTCSKNSQVESKFCGNCGFKLKKKVKFCPECGDKIDK